MIYICSVWGLYIKFYFKIPENYLISLVLLLFPLSIYIAFGYVNIRNSNKVIKDNELTGLQKLDLVNYIYDYFYQNEGLRYYKLTSILIVCFLFSIFNSALNETSLADLTINILITFANFASFMYLLLYPWENSPIKNGIYGQVTFGLFLLLFLIIIKKFFYIFIILFNIIMSHINDFVISSLTIILLGATLSLLAFTYNMVLTEEEEAEKKKKMKNNGEKFFIATIISLFFLILIFSLSVFCNYSNILLYGNINFLDKATFINVNVFVFLLLTSLIALILSLGQIISGIFSSLNNLLS